MLPPTRRSFTYLSATVIYTRAFSFTKGRKPLIAFIGVVTLIFACVHLSFSSPSKAHDADTTEINRTLPVRNGTSAFVPDTSRDAAKKTRFAKVTVASGFEDILYERALDTHVQHAIRHGYPMYMARENAANWAFNKIAYILDILLNELFKPADERVEWLFYSDADSIIMNQEIPIDIFEPPSDFSHINWLAGKDFNGLNAGVFLLRVNQWSLNLLVRTMTYKHYHPGEDYAFEEQSILARLTENDDEFKGESIYVPKAWFNAYFYDPQEVEPGRLLSHFAGPDFKWHMSTWLGVLKSESRFVYNRAVTETSYLEEIKRFWSVKRRADKAIKGFEINVNRGADPIVLGMQHDEIKNLAGEFRDRFEELMKASGQSPDDTDGLERLIDQAEEVNANLIQALMRHFETHDGRPPAVAF